MRGKVGGSGSIQKGVHPFYIKNCKFHYAFIPY